MEYCSSPKRYLQTAAPSNGQVPVHGPWTYGHFCGAGGMGNPINGTDAACQQHDACYAQAGLSPGSKFQGPNAQLKGCNQNLCNAVRGARQSIINQAAARGTRNSREVSPVYLPGSVPSTCRVRKARSRLIQTSFGCSGVGNMVPSRPRS